ncbi:hypothetical protein ACFO3O_13335 [Dokdonia ponticola]|uniref:Bacteriocin n=1 Tax=Dokdonia ponticola TaxID=2041041 RepID=A0ABV9HXI3_9FLAO
MKNLLKIGRSLNNAELKKITAGFGETFTRPGDEGCSAYECPSGMACNLWGECIPNGGGGGGDICPENVGMQC